MDPLDLGRRCKQRLLDSEPTLLDLLTTITDCAELAALATAGPGLLGLWGLDSPALQLGFREAVRDRYRDLIQAQLSVSR